jgi:hypothetical protein
MASAIIRGVVVTGSVDEIAELIRRETTTVVVCGTTNVTPLIHDTEIAGS